jgi:hypothetical protein
MGVVNFNRAKVQCLTGLGILLTTVATATITERPDSSTVIVTAAMKLAKNQAERLPPYSVVRRYTIKNKHLAAPAAMRVLWKYSPHAGKHYQILDAGNATGVARDALLRVLNDEADSSKLRTDPAGVTPDHYIFEATQPDETCYKLHLTPKTKTKYLLNGYAYVARDAGFFVRIEGTTSKRISFWVGEATITQEFANYSGYWLPSRTQSTAEVRLIGRTELSIEASDYNFSNR